MDGWTTSLSFRNGPLSGTMIGSFFEIFKIEHFPLPNHSQFFHFGLKKKHENPDLWFATVGWLEKFEKYSYQMVVKSRAKNPIKSNSQNIHLKNQKTSYLINSDPTFNRNSSSAHIILLPLIVGLPTSFGLKQKNHRNSPAHFESEGRIIGKDRADRGK